MTWQHKWQDRIGSDESMKHQQPHKDMKATAKFLAQLDHQPILQRIVWSAFIVAEPI